MVFVVEFFFFLFEAKLGVVTTLFDFDGIANCLKERKWDLRSDGVHVQAYKE